MKEKNVDNNITKINREPNQDNKINIVQTKASFTVIRIQSLNSYSSHPPSISNNRATKHPNK